jgi:hypothetical protein
MRSDKLEFVLNDPSLNRPWQCEERRTQYIIAHSQMMCNLRDCP